MLVLTVILIIAASLIFLLFSSVKASVIFTHTDDGNGARLTIKYLFIKKEIPLESKTKGKKEKVEEDLPKKGIKFYYSLYKTIKKELFELIEFIAQKAIVFENIDIAADFGSADAMATGIMTGTLNAFFYSIIGYIHNNLNLKDFNIDLNPDFYSQKFDVRLKCILRLKVVHIINIAVRGIKILYKIRKTNKKGRRK